MAHRSEEKARRKAEREAAEREAAKRAKRARLLQLGVGGVLVAALVVGIVALVVAGGDSTAAGGDGPVEAAGEEVQNVSLPPQRAEDLQAAVEAAGCQLREHEDQGGEHVEGVVPISYYKSNPPSSGRHNPIPAEDGVYPPGSPPAVENWLHSAEHGRILVQYAQGTPQQRIDQLRALVREPVLGAPGGYHTLVFQNNTNMPFQVAAVNWTRTLGCPQFNDRVWDALRLFREEYTDDAPEKVP
ncbi:MAG TPA: DUF3105 domain-containing protein [Solirubrobacteraceae bacterium]|nr:DUF3105 domain-containing protein [Solirubrobacteraceae bacterium]